MFNEDDDVKQFQVALEGMDPQIYGHLLIRACEIRCPRIAKYLIDAKADVTSTECSLNQWTALHFAVSCKDLDTQKLTMPLLAARANIEAQTSEGNTPLMFAWNQPDCLRMLLESKANPMKQNFRGETVFDWVETNSQSDGLIRAALLGPPPTAPPAPVPSVTST